MPMMPIDPANAVMNVRPFFVMRLLNESESAVRKPIDARPPLSFSPVRPAGSGACAASPAGEKDADSGSSAKIGSRSSTMRPSRTRTMRVA